MVFQVFYCIIAFETAMRQQNFAKQKIEQRKIVTKRLTPNQTTRQKTIKRKINNIPRELFVCACVCVVCLRKKKIIIIIKCIYILYIMDRKRMKTDFFLCVCALFKI